jgi:ABC-type multidrug transport system fused ATPase/permease subunit
MKTDVFGKILFSILILFLVALIIVTIVFWNKVHDTFFSYTLSDIFNVILTIFIGVVVTSYFSLTFSHSEKRLEILIDSLNMLQGYYTDIINAFSDSTLKYLSETNKRHLVKIIRLASNEYSDLKAFFHDASIDERKFNEIFSGIETKHFKLKEIITDVPFAKKRKVNDDDVEKATECYYLIKKNIQKIKLYLYK